MIAIGIDVSKGKSTVAAVGEGKKVIQKPYEVAHSKTELTKLIESIKKYDDEVRVVMEHTGVYYRVVAEMAVFRPADYTQRVEIYSFDENEKAVKNIMRLNETR